MTTLDNHAIKKYFPSFDNDLIDSIVAFAQVKEVKAGDTIIRKGQYIKYVVLVLSGSVKIYTDGEDGGEFFMYFLNAGQACAVSMVCATQMEMSSITAVAEEDTTLLLVPLAMMEKWMSQHKSWYKFVVASYRNRFDEILRALDQVAFRGMDERLTFYLRRQAKHLQTNTLHLSHQQIATDLNSTREVISRLLKKMEQRNLLKLQRNQIVLEASLLGEIKN